MKRVQYVSHLDQNLTDAEMAACKLNDMCIKPDQTTSGRKDKHMHRQTDRQTDIPIYHTSGYTATPVACGWAGADT